MTTKNDIKNMICDLVDMASEIGSSEGNDSWAPLDTCKVEYYEDIPVVLIDEDGSEYWIRVEKKRK
jgi:hypothetical protein